MKEQQLFKPSIVSRLAQAARVAPVTNAKGEITRKLSELGHSFLLNRKWQEKPPPSSLAKRLRAIRSAAEELAKKLPNGEADAEVRYRLTAQATVKVTAPELANLASGHARLKAASGALSDLVAWSRAAEKRESHRKGRAARNKGDEAAQALINGLAEVWLEYWRQFPGTSSNDGKVSGPFVRFVGAYCEALKKNLAPEDFAPDNGLRKALTMTGAAVRARARKSPAARMEKEAKRISAAVQESGRKNERKAARGWASAVMADSGFQKT